MKESIDGNIRECQEKSGTMWASISTETRKAFRSETFKKLLGNSVLKASGATVATIPTRDNI